MAGLHAPLPTLRRRPRGRLRTDRGRRGLLLLHRSGLSPHTPCQSPGALTHVAACTLARSPIRDPLPEGFSHFVSSMTAPVASGGSEIAGWAFHPLERCRLSTAHTQSGHGDLSTQARVKADNEFTALPRLGNGRGALERWPRKQALTIGRGAGTEQRGEVGLSHSVERITERNVGKRHPPRHQEVTTLQPLLE